MRMAFLLENYAEFPAYFIGLNDPLEELERREVARGIRQTGLAERQLQGSHLQKVYDLEINTQKFPPETCAQQFKQDIQRYPPFALDELTARMNIGEMIGKEDRI